MNEIKIKIKCFYCFCEEFLLPEDYTPEPGALIECANCGRGNDYDSLMRIVKKKGEDWVKEQAQALIDDFTKSLNKIFK